MSEAAVEYAPEIKELGDKIVGLTLMQAKQLADYLKDVHGIEAASGGAVMMAAAPAAAEEAAEDEGPSVYDVVLTEIGENKLQVIKAVREVTTLGLKEAKTLVESAPAPVKEQLEEDQAKEIKAKLEEVGAKVELK